jgi:hypothetical protein
VDVMWLLWNDMDGSEAAVADARKRLISLLKESIARSFVSKGLTQSRLPRMCHTMAVLFN